MLETREGYCRFITTHRLLPSSSIDKWRHALNPLEGVSVVIEHRCALEKQAREAAYHIMTWVSSANYPTSLYFLSRHRLTRKISRNHVQNPHTEHSISFLNIYLIGLWTKKTHLLVPPSLGKLSWWCNQVMCISGQSLHRVLLVATNRVSSFFPALARSVRWRGKLASKS